MVKLTMEPLVGRREDRLSLCDDAQEGSEQQNDLPSICDCMTTEVEAPK